MSIIHIVGPAQSGKSLIANSMRNTHIGKSQPADGIFYGALLVDDTHEGEPRYLLEKLLLGGSLGALAGDGPARPQSADKVKWKTETLVIFVNDKIELLENFEELAPGFTKMFGPVKRMGMSVV